MGNSAQMVLGSVGMLGVGSYNVENGFITGITAFNGAWHDVAAGLHDLVLVFGGGSFGGGGMGAFMPGVKFEGGSLFINPRGNSWETKKVKNPTYPRLFAQLARRHMKEYGTTREQLAKVAVKNHKNGALNPQAMYKQGLSLEEVLNSEMIAEPLTKYMCSSLANGGVAFILCPSNQASYFQDKPVRIASCAITSGKAGVPYLESAYEGTERAAREAYRMIDPFFRARETIDVAQVHDAFSITELISYEALGLCGRGKSGEWIDSGATELGGELPVNTDGGIMANGYALGASDLAQIAESVYQLRGKAGDRQVPEAKWALTHIMGSSPNAFCGGIGGRGFGPGGGYGVAVFTNQ
jgi:acetyl-CoA acetyltransferase